MDIPKGEPEPGCTSTGANALQKIALTCRCEDVGCLLPVGARCEERWTVEANSPDLGVAIRVGVALGLLVLTAVYIYAARKGRRSTSSWVVSKLSGPEDRVTVTVSTLDYVWNPSKPLGIDNGLFGPGEGTYLRESRPDGDLIHLYFQRAGEHVAEHHAGPIPDSAIAGTAANLHTRW